MESIEVAVSNHVAYVTICRPEVMNCLDLKAESELAAAVRRLDRDPSVHVAVLTGAGERSFCAGSDMRDDSLPSSFEYWADEAECGFGGLADPMRTLPIVARVNGYALGGGLELVLGCDMAVSADSAQFGFPEPRVGWLPLGAGVVAALKGLSKKHAMELLLTGKRVNAHRAKELGVVNHVVPPDELDGAVEAVVADIVKCAPLQLRAIKDIANRTAHLSAREATSSMTPALRAAMGSDARVEGSLAYEEKRDPDWWRQG